MGADAPVLEGSETIGSNINDAITHTCCLTVKESIARNGNTIVVTVGVPLGQAMETNLIKARMVNEKDV